MEFLVFSIVFALVLVLGARGIMIASKLKNEINYPDSALNLHYVIQSNIISGNIQSLNITTPLSEVLFNKCLNNIRLSFGFIGLFCILIFAVG